MNRRKLAKLKVELEQMRRGSVRAADVQSLAARLGRKSVKRGKEPMWENAQFPELFVLAIPDHGGRDLSPGVKRSVLNQLEEDITAWDEKLSLNGHGHTEEPEDEADDSR